MKFSLKHKKRSIKSTISNSTIFLKKKIIIELNKNITYNITNYAMIIMWSLIYFTKTYFSKSYLSFGLFTSVLLSQ